MTYIKTAKVYKFKFLVEFWKPFDHISVKNVCFLPGVKGEFESSFFFCIGGQKVLKKGSSERSCPLWVAKVTLKGHIRTSSRFFWVTIRKVTFFHLCFILPFFKAYERSFFFFKKKY